MIQKMAKEFIVFVFFVYVDDEFRFNELPTAQTLSLEDDDCWGVLLLRPPTHSEGYLI